MSPEGQAALRVLRVAMEGVRHGRIPATAYVDAAFGDSVRRLADYCPDAVNPRIVLVAIEALRHRGVTHITVNCARYRERNWDCNRALAKLDALPTLTLVASVRWEGDVVRLYQLK